MKEPPDSIVARARKILVETVRKASAESRRDDKAYFRDAAESIEHAQPAKIDSWLALDAVISALSQSS